MNKCIHLAGLSGLAILLFLTPVYAQDDETAPPSTTDPAEAATEEPEIRAGQEVEINEDNYRQFMELKDPTLQREIIPENAFKPGSGLQKLDKLPEESQKHLRNQLREIIVQGDPWQPGDEETEYPYTPSEAAGQNPALEKEELEAWGELVDSYHDRESQIYENSSGSQAARGSEQGSSNSQENGKGSPGSSSQDGESSQSQQAGQEGNPKQSETEGTYSVDGSANPNANSTAGVSQNAMEFLQGLGKGGSNTESGNQGDSPMGDGPGGNSPTPTEGQSQAQAGQQSGSEQAGPENTGGPAPGGDPNANSTAGSSQNAMEFLQGLGQGSAGSGEGDGQDSSESTGEANTPSAGEGQAYGQSNNPGNTEQGSNLPPDPESTAGSSQNAMEFLKSMSTQGGNQSGSDANPSGSDDGQAESRQNNQAIARASVQQDGQEQGQKTTQAQGQEMGQKQGQDNGQGDSQAEQQADSQNEGQTQDSQQTETEQEPDLAEQPTSTSAASPTEAEEESTAGAAQNALEYLTGDAIQTGDGTDPEQDANQVEGTLSLQDLLNAQGVSDRVGEVPVATSPDEEQQIDETKPKKDGDG